MEKILVWNGSIDASIDKVKSMALDHVGVGIFGGASSEGTLKNEDGLIVMTGDDGSVFSVLFDAHATNASVLYLTHEILLKKDLIFKYLNYNTALAIGEIEKFFESWLKSETTLRELKALQGETAFLICLQKGAYLWWLSVGDNSLYALHKEFSELGQYRLNQRVFYQWLGEKNSMDLTVQCYSKGTIQLRQGKTIFVMLTDGVLEIEGRPFEDNETLNRYFQDLNIEDAIEKILSEVEILKGRDNASMIAWAYDNPYDGLRPTRL